MLKWNHIYKRISLMDNPQSVLDQIEKEGNRLTKWELSRVVRHLRKFRRYNLALQIYEWMHNRMERFRLSGSDTAIQLDLIAKVQGVSCAEDYFIRMPDTLKDNRIYGALLNAYVGAKVRDKAEALMVQMRNKGYANHPLPFNVMMTLYMKLNEYDKVEELVSEMINKAIRLDLYSYNIWLSSRGSQGSAQGMEDVFQQMQLDLSINPNWTTFSTMASFYIKFGELEKAEQFLKNLELRITGRDKMPYHYLISLYGSLGNKEEVYRVWNMYKSTFQSIPNWGYHTMISSVIRLGDIEGAKRIYEEWLPVKGSYDPKIGNLMMGGYAKDGALEKIKGFFDHMVEAGGKPNSGSWEILGEVQMKEGRICEALSCFKEAALSYGSENWKPRPANICAFLELCEKEGDRDSTKEVFVGLLRQVGCFEDENYRSVLGGENYGEVENGDEQLLMADHKRRPSSSNGNDEMEEMEGEVSETLGSIEEY